MPLGSGAVAAGVVLERLYPLDRARNADGARRPIAAPTPADGPASQRSSGV